MVHILAISAPNPLLGQLMFDVIDLSTLRMEKKDALLIFDFSCFPTITTPDTVYHTRPQLAEERKNYRQNNHQTD